MRTLDSLVKICPLFRALRASRPWQKRAGRPQPMARERYRRVVEDFLTVLDTERRQLEAQDALAGARADNLLALVAVYRALGGGWQEAFGPSDVATAGGSPAEPAGKSG